MTCDAGTFFTAVPPVPDGLQHPERCQPQRTGPQGPPLKLLRDSDNLVSSSAASAWASASLASALAFCRVCLRFASFSSVPAVASAALGSAAAIFQAPGDSRRTEYRYRRSLG